MDNISNYNLRSCPFCGSNKLSFAYKSNQGHGDRTYSDLRVVCLNEDCVATTGIGNWGDPDSQAYLRAVVSWNKRKTL